MEVITTHLCVAEPQLLTEMCGGGACDGVQEGQDVVEFDKMCEVQSDKASVEITSRYTGTVAKLHAAPGDIVQVLWSTPSMNYFLSGSRHFSHSQHFSHNLDISHTFSTFLSFQVLLTAREEIKNT